MDEDRLPRQVIDCSLARSVAEDGRMEQLKLRPGHRNIKGFLGCTALQNKGAMRKVPVVAPLFGTFSSYLASNQLIPWPEIPAAAAKRALDRQALRYAIENLASLEFDQRSDLMRSSNSGRRCGVLASGKASETETETVAVPALVCVLRFLQLSIRWQVDQTGLCRSCPIARRKERYGKPPMQSNCSQPLGLRSAPHGWDPLKKGPCSKSFLAARMLSAPQRGWAPLRKAFHQRALPYITTACNQQMRCRGKHLERVWVCYEVALQKQISMQNPSISHILYQSREHRERAESKLRRF
eukprot:353596-Chlamydomonas_euryale.AAC.6